MPGAAGDGSPVTVVAEFQLDAVIREVEYLISYEATLTPEGGSEGADQLRVKEVV